MEKYSRVKALISLDAVEYNFEQMKKNIKEGTKIVAVIKADAYGHGAVPIARMIQEYDYIWGFATATAQEALQLRRAGIRKPVLVIGLVFEEYYEKLVENEIRMAVCDYETARKFDEAAKKNGKKG
ncbi:MAG: alanine racemase [Blautia sp.]